MKVWKKSGNAVDDILLPTYFFSYRKHVYKKHDVEIRQKLRNT